MDLILNLYKVNLGKYFEQYKNHVYRVFNLALPYLNSDKEIEIISVASAFHDLGIWTNNTFDYIKPSIGLAKQFCVSNHFDASVIMEIWIIIDNHHKLTKIRTSKLAEIFRQADLVDLTFGLIPKGRNKNDVRLLRKTFPNKGFHLFLTKIFLKHLFNKPFNPLPMYKF